VLITRKPAVLSTCDPRPLRVQNRAQGRCTTWQRQALGLHFLSVLFRNGSDAGLPDLISDTDPLQVRSAGAPGTAGGHLSRSLPGVAIRTTEQPCPPFRALGTIKASINQPRHRWAKLELTMVVHLLSSISTVTDAHVGIP
jgi:hypothetical protein